jgi:hypothetical protein
MTLLARVLGFGLDVLEAMPRRGRVSLPLAVGILLVLGLWPELLLEMARLRVEPVLDAVAEAVQDAATRAQGG